MLTIVSNYCLTTETEADNRISTSASPYNRRSNKYIDLHDAVSPTNYFIPTTLLSTRTKYMHALRAPPSPSLLHRTALMEISRISMYAGGACMYTRNISQTPTQRLVPHPPHYPSGSMSTEMPRCTFSVANATSKNGLADCGEATLFEQQPVHP